MPYTIDEEGRVFGSFYWIAPANAKEWVKSWGPPVTAYDRDSMGDKLAYKAAKEAIKDLYKSMGVRNCPRLKVYGSDFVEGVLFIERANGEVVNVADLVTPNEDASAPFGNVEDQRTLPPLVSQSPPVSEIGPEGQAADRVGAPDDEGDDLDSDKDRWQLGQLSPARATSVLLIEDEAPIRLLCRVNLEAHGMHVTEAADGITGLDMAQRMLPDMILLDVMLPGLDGWRVGEHLQTDPATREIPIVFLTPRKQLRDRARGIDLGAVDYITMPFNPLELGPRIDALLVRTRRGERNEMRREKLAELRTLLEREAEEVAEIEAPESLDVEPEPEGSEVKVGTEAYGWDANGDVIFDDDDDEEKPCANCGRRFEEHLVTREHDGTLTVMCVPAELCQQCEQPAHKHFPGPNDLLFCDPSATDMRVYTRTSAESDLKVCPDCAETIKAAARVCRFCGYRYSYLP